jgi:hypothetical protein
LLAKSDGARRESPPRPSTVKVVEVGMVGSLDYKIIAAGRADDLYTWLKENKYSFSGDEATLDYYIKKKWYFTVMKIDTMQMKKKPDGSFQGDVTPTRFTFATEKLIYPVKITQVSVKDKTDALFYVQAPSKVDLPGDMTSEYHWVGQLRQQEGIFGAGSLSLTNRTWLAGIREHESALEKRRAELGFTFLADGSSQPNKEGRHGSTLEWAKRLTAQDISVLKGEAPYSETLPGPGELPLARPKGYLVRNAAPEDIAGLKILAGHLREGQFLTKFRKVFTRAELEEDLELVPAQVGKVVDVSEHEESPRGAVIMEVDVDETRPGFRDIDPGITPGGDERVRARDVLERLKRQQQQRR